MVTGVPETLGAHKSATDTRRAATACDARRRGDGWQDADDMCAHLVATVVGQANEDDVTVLAVRIPLRSDMGALTWAAAHEPAIPPQVLAR